MGAVVRLSWTSLRQSLRRDAPARGRQLAALALAIFAVCAFVGLSWQLDEPTETDRFWRANLSLLTGAIAFLVGMFAHAEDPLDERALVQAGQRPATAAFSALIAALCSPRGVVWLLGGLLTAMSSLHGGTLLAGGLVGMCLALIDRAGVVSARGLVEYGVAREARAIGGYVITEAVGVAGYTLLLLPWQAAIAQFDAAYAETARWLPLSGAMLANSLDDPATASRTLAVAAAPLLVLLVVLFAFGVRTGRRLLVARSDGGASRFGLMGAAAGGASRAIAWRIGMAWLRDHRYVTVMVTVIILPVLIVIPLLIGGADRGWMALLPLPLATFLLGWAIHNDLAFDSSASWLHFTSGMRGSADRFGRALPSLIIGIVAVIGGVAFLGLLVNGWPQAFATGAVALALLLVSLGGSSIMSVVVPYAVARPDDPPLSQPIRSWGAAVFAHPIAGLIEAALCLPVMLAAIRAINESSWAYVGLASALAVGIGAVCLWGGVAIGGKLYERRAVQLLHFAQQN